MEHCGSNTDNDEAVGNLSTAAAKDLVSSTYRSVQDKEKIKEPIVSQSRSGGITYCKESVQESILPHDSHPRTTTSADLTLSGMSSNNGVPFPHPSGRVIDAVRTRSQLRSSQALEHAEKSFQLYPKLELKGKARSRHRQIERAEIDRLYFNALHNKSPQDSSSKMCITKLLRTAAARSRLTRCVPRAADVPLWDPAIARLHCPSVDGSVRLSNPDKDRLASLSKTFWSESEKLSFLRLFQRHGKKFSNIADLLKPKTRNDVVQFYYCNKMALDLKRVLRSALQSRMLGQDEMKQLIRKTTLPSCAKGVAQPELPSLPCSDLDVRSRSIKKKTSSASSMPEEI